MPPKKLKRTEQAIAQKGEQTEPTLAILDELNFDRPTRGTDRMDAKKIIWKTLDLQKAHTKIRLKFPFLMILNSNKSFSKQSKGPFQGHTWKRIMV
jgi:hypothetical protein